MPFHPGDKVKMSEIAKAKWRNSDKNPYDLSGEVVRLQPFGPLYMVRWDNQNINGYNEEHLIPAPQPVKSIFNTIIDEFDFDPAVAFEAIRGDTNNIHYLKALARDALEKVLSVQERSCMYKNGCMLAIKQGDYLALVYVPFGVGQLTEIPREKPVIDGIRKIDLDE